MGRHFICCVLLIVTVQCLRLSSLAGKVLLEGKQRVSVASAEGSVSVSDAANVTISGNEVLKTST